ncbi:hypothetical protein ABDD95_21125 [Mucilaginibacter sp. PAMB04274]|uniref:hypothetical protein n=1 Tax=Mucilaginibacter sp. PAMB04274 TaxID=3138568 RepID=UPI0031F67852
MKKILNLTVIITIITAGLLLSGCDKENVSSSDSIKYGTSFGMCAGYCNNEVTVKQSGVQLIRKKNGGPETKTCQKSLTEEQWKQIIDKIDFEKFSKLNAVYGCPDCADGGAEWIEIQRGQTKHKVTFEYHGEPEALKGYIADLRQQMASFEDCK